MKLTIETTEQKPYNVLCVKELDILILYTSYEILNHNIIFNLFDHIPMVTIKQGVLYDAILEYFEGK